MSYQNNTHPPQFTAKAHSAVKEKRDDDEYITYSAFSTTINQTAPDHFLVNTGTNTHIVFNSSLLSDICPILPVNINGHAGTNRQVTTSFQGTGTIPGITTGRRACTIEIKDVILAPNAGVNLLAVSIILLTVSLIW